MTEYRVTWDIDVEADSEVEAARSALEIQRNPRSEATVFTVATEHGPVTVDLTEIDQDLREAYDQERN